MLPRSALLRRNLARSLARRQSAAAPIPDARRFLTTRPDLVRPWRRKSFRGLAGLERNLATALDNHRPTDDIPFEGLPNSLAQYDPPGSLYKLQPFDISNPLIVHDNSPVYEKSRVDTAAIPGTVEEMLAVFDACIAVGKLERASLVLKRLSGFLMDPAAMMELHNCYLFEMLFQIQEQPDLDAADDMHSWFELQIHDKGLPHTPDTIAFLLKATLLTCRGDRLNRLVERYMEMLPQETALESLYLADVLTAKDLATIAEICPSYDMPDDAFLFPDVEAPVDGAVPGTSSQWTEVPGVLSTPQKGTGLKALKGTLSLFAEIPEGYDIASLSKAERREIQTRLEKDTVDAAVARWREENESLKKMGLNTSFSTATLNSRLFEWQKSLEEFISDDMAKIDESERSRKKTPEEVDRCIYGPFFRQSTPERLAAVTILSVLSGLSLNGADKGVGLATILMHLARTAEQDIGLHNELKARPKYRTAAKKRNFLRLMRQGAVGEIKASSEAAPNAAVETVRSTPVWSSTIRTKVAAVLLSGLIKVAKVQVTREHPVTKETISQIQPAFTHAIQLRKGRKIGVLIPNPTLVELMSREPRGEVLARHLPMVAEPDPWAKFDKGGFLASQVPLVRIKEYERDQKHYAQAAIARGDMDQVLRALDVLGKTAWRVNRPVFEVMLHCWNTGEAIASIPALNPEIVLPEEPDQRQDPLGRLTWMRAVRAAENERSGMHSVRCFMNFQLEIARAFRDQTFYFPHNIDFRGRAYPIPTYLNHMGADHVRGLLMFAKGKPLGENGLKWLKVQLANVYGYDKASLSEREAFAVEHMDDIRDSAKNPINGKQWWLQAEDPWQCLAACFELVAALESPDPTQYVSHLPVHQDGTCNGLQHYAALGGDTWGAQQVNLIPQERPADVYSAVAELINEIVDKDAANGVTLAKGIQGKITRKVVKQTVMTNVYGVTYVGAKKQVRRQLETLYPDLPQETGISSHLFSAYIASNIFKALSTMFHGAHEIQHWLIKIGDRVCRSVPPEQIDELAAAMEAAAAEQSSQKKGTRQKYAKETPVKIEQFQETLVWTTPLRMPVVQPYRKSGTRKIETCMQSLYVTDPDRSDPVHRVKQLQAFPPNFIHSLDASHMLLSALECDERGLTFAAVHDSFWTHACDIDVMSDVLRDSFIRIHSEDVIGRLSAEFQARYRHSLYLVRVPRSSPIGQQVTAHRRKNRMSLHAEMVMEHRRQKLLRSTDALDVKEGQEMVTPASIVGNDLDAADMAWTEEVLREEEEEEVASAAESDDVDVDAAADLDESGSATVEPKKQWNKNMIEFWAPLTFPPVPKKGDFDVRQLKTSKYFFS
ncbi:hypothetical protein QBC47DRAFT_390107 [Echria macrotheca]|uniref:DNA-directed RNA polymerase n=1 Tax=Echria macrotheca TaxID=438768 RepID=A0AAJ0B894_9PEZI|nr:hypothetical protein QBC47DRAFT_390107 [Echria macrotheca]